MSDLDETVRGVNDIRLVGEQLRGFDAATWRAALLDRGARSVIMGLLVFDKAPDWEQFRARWERLTRMVPVLRKRPIFGEFRLSPPRLAVDADFDLDIHVRRMRLPEGEGWEGVLKEARRMSLTDFDRDRPLWETALIEGLPDGRAAVITKLHHAIGDGQATLEIGMNLFEIGPEGNPDEPEAPPPPEGENLSTFTVTEANIQDNLTKIAQIAAKTAQVASKFALNTLKNPVDTLSDAATLAGSVSRFTAIPESELSPLMNGRCTTYTFRTFQVPFAELRAASKRENATVNDIFLACVSTGLAKYHDRHGLPTRRLRFNIPISLRGTSKDGSEANAVTIARFPLPVNGVTVEERIAAAHEQVRRWRDEPALALTKPLASVSWMVPVPVLSSAMRASDVTVSNVPGPPIPLYLCGARLIGQWPLVATVGAATNITMVTYDGTAFIGVSADDEAVPDVDNLVADLEAGFQEVLGGPSGSTDSGSGGSKKKTPAKKTPAKKTPAKKTAAKKASSGKPAAKKAPAKKPTGDEASADKKTPAKKASAKKAPAKKASAKKAKAEKPAEKDKPSDT